MTDGQRERRTNAAAYLGAETHRPVCALLRHCGYRADD